MTLLAQVNRKRDWLLFAAIWLAAVGVYSWDEVYDRYRESPQARSELNRSLRESRYLDCLERNNVILYGLWLKYRTECAAEAQKPCRADGTIWTCGKDYIAHLADLCVKTKVAACSDIALMTAGDGSPFTGDYNAFRRKERYEELVYYWTSHFSEPLKRALLLGFLPLAILAIAPAFVRKIWNWLTSAK